MKGIDFRIEGDSLFLKKTLSKKETYKINNKKRLFSLTIYDKPIEVVGFTSMCGDMNHIILIDYDNTSKLLVIDDITRIQKEFRLTPFYLFTTKEKKMEGVVYGNYHLICLTKEKVDIARKIISDTHCDNAYKTMPLRNIFRSWVLRTSNKGKRPQPKYLGIVGKEINLSNEISSPHLKLLEKLYKVKKINYKNNDNLKILYKNVYETNNY